MIAKQFMQMCNRRIFSSENSSIFLWNLQKANETRKINNLSLLMLILKISKGKFLERRNNAYFVKQFSKSHWRKSQKCFFIKENLTVNFDKK
tara:strand:- start:409 stop:684 length:276 start_codon:yes stop_codon:yes gene_type:complete